MQLLPAELWDEIVAAQWSGIVDGTDSSYESLPDVSALACTCWAAHLALRSFMAAKKGWFLELRSRSVQLCARGQLHAAEVRTTSNRHDLSGSASPGIPYKAGSHTHPK